MKILGTGLTGLVGSRIVELLSDHHEFVNISTSSGVDITNSPQVSQSVVDTNPDIIIHLAAKTHVDECEKDKEFGEKGEAWKVNVEGTQNIATAAKSHNKKLIYISTDFVFDGEKQESYIEEDIPNPINWYGKTKYEGEKIVQELLHEYLILRIAYPYRAAFSKLDFSQAILKRLQKKASIIAVTDHVFTPTYIDDIAFSLDRLLNGNTSGIFHAVGSQSLTPFEAAIFIAKTFGFETSNIAKTTREEYFKNGAPRPFKLALKNDKMKRLGSSFRTFEQGIIDLKENTL